MIRDEAYWAHIRAIVDEAPPLSEEQKTKLALIFRPVIARQNTQQKAALR